MRVDTFAKGPHLVGKLSELMWLFTDKSTGYKVYMWHIRTIYMAAIRNETMYTSWWGKEKSWMRYNFMKFGFGTIPEAKCKGSNDWFEFCRVEGTRVTTSGLFWENVCVDKGMIYIGRRMIQRNDCPLNHLTYACLEATLNAIDNVDPFIKNVEIMKEGLDDVCFEQCDNVTGIKCDTCTWRCHSSGHHTCCIFDILGTSCHEDRCERPQR